MASYNLLSRMKRLEQETAGIKKNKKIYVINPVDHRKLTKKQLEKKYGIDPEDNNLIIINMPTSEERIIIDSLPKK